MAGNGGSVVRSFVADEQPIITIGKQSQQSTGQIEEMAKVVLTSALIAPKIKPPIANLDGILSGILYLEQILGFIEFSWAKVHRPYYLGTTITKDVVMYSEQPTHSALAFVTQAKSQSHIKCNIYNKRHHSL